MRVLLVNNHYAFSGGAETVVLQTERLLRDAGHDVVPFAVAEDGTLPTPWRADFPPGRPGGTTGARTGGPFTGVYSLAARRRLGALLDRERIDVAHLHNVYEGLTLSVVDALRARRIPAVMTLHDYRAVCPNGLLRTAGGPCTRCLGGRFHTAVRHRCVRGSIRLSAVAAAEAALNRAARRYARLGVLIAPSRFLRDQMVAGGLPADRIALVPNAVPDVEEALPPGAAPTFVYAGRLTPDKGLDTLLSAAAELRGTGARVVVFGTGRSEAQLRRRVREEGLPVEFRGHVERPGLDGATAAVIPSLWFENCPLAVLEASARGVPPIASALGGMAELIDPGRDGLLVRPGDAGALAAAMRSLAADPGLARRLGAAARRRVQERHGEAEHLDRVLSCYARAAVAA